MIGRDRECRVESLDRGVVLAVGQQDIALSYFVVAGRSVQQVRARHRPDGEEGHAGDQEENGEAPGDPAVHVAELMRSRTGQTGDPALAALTPREREVLQLAAEFDVDHIDADTYWPIHRPSPPFRVLVIGR